MATAIDSIPNVSSTRVLQGSELQNAISESASRSGEIHPARDLRWLTVLEEAFGHKTFLVEAANAGQRHVLPLCFVQSRLFGRFLVSLPYVNSGGCDELSDDVAHELISRAVTLADDLDCDHLELRHERACVHESLTEQVTSKIHMRLKLPATPEELRASLKSKVRSQVKKGEANPFQVLWGQEDLLSDFYNVFSRNMRDLGTPVFGRQLFRSILKHFENEAELCVLKLDGKPIAGALLIHGGEVTEVPSASTLREFNHTNANMVMYWNLLARAVERGQTVFDFGRSTEDSTTFKFKKQWGALPSPAVWQYYVRRGSVGDNRKESKKFQRAIALWKKLPLPVANLLGPSIVRGIP